MTRRNGGGALAKPEQRGQEMMRHVAVELARKQQFLKAMLPKEVTPERMRALVLTSFQRNPKLLECDIASILGAVYEAAKIGLEPDTVGQECYLIPYKRKATFQLGFKGMMKLARRGRVNQIWSGTVRQRDKFLWEEGTSPALTHLIPRDESGIPHNEEQRGRLVAAYACARFDDSYVQFRVVLEDEVKRAKGSAQTDNVWRTWEGPMWEKTAIKRLCKVLPMPDAVLRAVELDDIAETGGEQNLDRSWSAAPTDPKTEGGDAPDAPAAEDDAPDPDGHYPGD